ncbi:hypothetical protein [Pseudomonas sp. H2_G03]
MSVSSLDTPVSNPLPPERVQANATAQPEAKASRPGLSTLSFNGQHAANVNFSPWQIRAARYSAGIQRRHCITAMPVTAHIPTALLRRRALCINSAIG